MSYMLDHELTRNRGDEAFNGAFFGVQMVKNLSGFEIKVHSLYYDMDTAIRPGKR